MKVSDQSERPDILGMVLVDSNLEGPVCVGEVKGEDRINDTYLCAYDVIKIASFSKEAIDTKEYQASISIPSSIHDMKAFIANLEDILPLRAMYKKCIQNNNKVQLHKKKGANLQSISHFLKSGKDRKRHCSFVFNH
ncbi:hypothetical protein MBANPS3_010640 [Mucor bainieri]